MAYVTQDATVGTEVNRFYGVQNQHNHSSGTKFGQTIRGIMKATYGDRAVIEMGHFASNQSRVPTGGRRVVELKWKNNEWTQ